MGRLRLRVAVPFFVGIIVVSYLTFYTPPVDSSAKPPVQNAKKAEPKVEEREREEPPKKIIQKMTMSDLLKVNISRMTLREIERLYRDNAKVIRDEVTLRVVRINSKCEDERPNHRIYNMYAFNELSVSWCPVFKSGSTTWKNYFVSSFYPKYQPPFPLNALEQRKLSGSYSATIAGRRIYRHHENHGNIRFMVVRDPLSRLVSHSKSSQRRVELHNMRDGWIKEAIINARGGKLDKKHDEMYRNELSRYLETANDELNSKVKISDDNPYLHPPYPLFTELINHVEARHSSGRGFDGHWFPAAKWCDICQHRFDFIIKLENEPWEMLYLLDELGLWHDREKILSKYNKSSDKQTNSTQLLLTYRNMLTEHQKTFLNKVYKDDIEYFDYPPF